MHICTVVELDAKFVTVIEHKVIGISRHKDYSLFHFKARDVKALKVPISKFVFLDAKAEVDEVINADQLATRGVNYKTAKRDTAELTDVELAEVSAAVELARSAVRTDLPPKPEATTKPAVDQTPADGVPKVIITSEVAASGLGEGAFTAGGEVTCEGASEGSGDELDGDEKPAAAGMTSDDPLVTMKTSRTKRRR